MSLLTAPLSSANSARLTRRVLVSVTMTRGAPQRFRSLSRNRLAAALFRRDWTRMSSTSPFASTARHSQCVLPLIRMTTSSRCHLSAGRGRSLRTFAANWGPKRTTQSRTVSWTPLDASRCQQIFNVTQTESEAVVRPNRVANDRARESKPLETGKIR